MSVYPDQRAMWRHDGTRKQFFVYIMSNTSLTLYTGITNDLSRRVDEHRNAHGSAFTAQYHFDRLVYFEIYELATEAIAREKAIKGWNRKKKIALIKSVNPEWRDLPPLVTLSRADGEGSQNATSEASWLRSSHFEMLRPLRASA